MRPRTCSPTRDRAASMAEYALLVTFIVVLLMVALEGFGETAQDNLEERGGHVGNPQGFEPTD